MASSSSSLGSGAVALTPSQEFKIGAVNLTLSKTGETKTEYSWQLIAKEAGKPDVSLTYKEDKSAKLTLGKRLQELNLVDTFILLVDKLLEKTMLAPIRLRYRL